MHVLARRVGRPAVFLALGVLLVAAPATWAGHSVTLTHVPPPAGVTGQPLTLTALADSDCAGLTSGCESIRVTAYYQAPNGTTKSVTTSAGDGGPVTLTIPGADVQRPSISYWIEASQDECEGIGGCTLDCHTTTTRSPAAGSHTVPVA